MPTAADKRNVIPQVAFNAGEVTAYLRGRIDLQKFQQGAAEITNFIVLPQGPITRRGGTVWQSSLDYVPGDEGDLPPELQIIPWDYITTPDGGSCPLILNYLNVPNDKVCIFNTDEVFHAPQGMDEGAQGKSWTVAFWVQIDELGHLFTYNQTVEIAGNDWWVGTRLYYDGFDWRIDSVWENGGTGSPSAVRKVSNTVSGLPNPSADGDCYHIALNWLWDPAAPIPAVTQEVIVNGSSVATSSDFGYGMANFEEWRTPTEAEGEYTFLGRTEKGTGATQGKIAQICFWANGLSSARPISVAGLNALYNSGAGMVRATMDTTADPTLGGFISDNLIFYVDFSNEANEPKYYSLEAGSSNDYIELVDFITTSNPEDTSIDSGW